ncbi:MAG: AAA family ATPase [Gemmataceae bacterium]|nr:AAA family ATPase [Gemmataceae bacterium]
MRIERLEFWDKQSGWHLAPTEFDPGLTLLVGASGAGKTRILEAIQELRSIALWDDRTLWAKIHPGLWGLAWDATLAIEGQRYRWEGEYELLPPGGLPAARESWESANGRDDPRPRPALLKEQLRQGGTMLIRRDAQAIVFQEQPTPKLAPSVSAVSLLAQEEAIRPISSGFRRVRRLDEPLDWRVYDLGRMLPAIGRIEDLKAVSIPLTDKLAVASRNFPDVFQAIIERFRAVFPFVDGLAFGERVPLGHHKEIHELQVKEKGVGVWLVASALASGMRRTLAHLAAMALSPDDSVILIDEFENSLGVNCLDAVTDEVLSESPRMQFLVTSHHPYILNNIPPKHWKIVSRAGSEVRTLRAEEVGIGRSRHEAFLQLVNSPAYRGEAPLEPAPAG